MGITKRIIGLDLVRFLAAFGIIAYHYFFIGVIQGFYSGDVFWSIAFWGELGVDIFFILSGFVILFSTESRRSPSGFLQGRLLRIYPSFVICSAITLLLGMIMPNTDAGDLIYRWANSLTLCCDIWGVQPLSSIYWTLMVEIKFYLLVAIVMELGVWEKYRYQILSFWIYLSLFNTLGPQWNWMKLLFNSNYSGHFAVGIILYLRYKGEKNKWMPLILGGGIWLIYKNCVSYTQWIRGIFPELLYSDTDILFAVIIMVLMIYLASNLTLQGRAFNKIIPFLGSWSYTIYLIHADFGYFIRTQYYNKLVVWIPGIANVVNEYVIMAAAVLLSFLLSFIVLKIVNCLTK